MDVGVWQPWAETQRHIQQPGPGGSLTLLVPQMGLQGLRALIPGRAQRLIPRGQDLSASHSQCQGLSRRLWTHSGILALGGHWRWLPSSGATPRGRRARIDTTHVGFWPRAGQWAGVGLRQPNWVTPRVTRGTNTRRWVYTTAVNVTAGRQRNAAHVKEGTKQSAVNQSEKWKAPRV